MNVKLVNPCYMRGTVLGCRGRAVIHTERISALRTYLPSRCWVVERVLFHSLPPFDIPADRGVLTVLSPLRLGNSYSSLLSTYCGAGTVLGAAPSGWLSEIEGLLPSLRLTRPQDDMQGRQRPPTTPALSLPLAQADGCCAQSKYLRLIFQKCCFFPVSTFV